MFLYGKLSDIVVVVVVVVVVIAFDCRSGKDNLETFRVPGLITYFLSRVIGWPSYPGRSHTMPCLSALARGGLQLLTVLADSQFSDMTMIHRGHTGGSTG